MINTVNFDANAGRDADSFSSDLLVYAHMALDSYAGNGAFALFSQNRARHGWTPNADDTFLDPTREAKFFEDTAYKNSRTENTPCAGAFSVLVTH